MAPVVRITDQVFERLKKLAEPLVDTPGSVIERLLDAYEAAATSRNPRLQPADGGDLDARPQATTIMPAPGFRNAQANIFLAPALADNIKVSIAKTVGFDVAQQFLPATEAEALGAALSGRTSFHCWATTTSNLATFREIRPGDVVLLTEKGTGKFTFVGKVVTKFHSEGLGNHLWPVVPGKPWELIFVLDDVRNISIEKSKLVGELGYQLNYHVQGIIRVKPSRVARVISRYGSVDEFLNGLG